MRAVRFLSRGVVVTALVTFHFLVWFVGWLGLLLTLRAKARRQRWFGLRMTALFIHLGATFVKVGQIMSTRPDLLPPHVTSALEKLQDDVGAFAYRHVERAFAHDFGKLPEDVFATFERVPIASASVAQVHRATLDDGTVVAVKVRRPRITDIVDFDLSVMHLFATIMSVIPAIRLLAPVESVAEFGRAIRMQIDLRLEADNNQRFRANFAGDPDVQFPVLVPDLCSARVLTMEFVEGVKILEFHRTESDPVRLARIGFHTLLKMIFDDAFVHADLHPGNILITPDDKVCILDLGLTTELDEEHRGVFAKFFSSWASRDGTMMAKIMSDMSPSARVRDYAGYEAEVVAFMDRYHGKALNEVQISQVAFDMMGILRRHRVRVNATFTMCNIAIAVTEGIGKQLAPELDLVNEALPFFAKLHARG